MSNAGLRFKIKKMQAILTLHNNMKTKYNQIK